MGFAPTGKDIYKMFKVFWGIMTLIGVAIGYGISWCMLRYFVTDIPSDVKLYLMIFCSLGGGIFPIITAISLARKI